MVAIGRALMARPRLLLLDEPSLGLAPSSSLIFEMVERINAEGVAVLLVEQNVAHGARRSRRRAYVLEEGRIVAEGDAGRTAGAAAHPARLSRRRGRRRVMRD